MFMSFAIAAAALGFFAETVVAACGWPLDLESVSSMA
jgi:hypothetical protein